MADEVKKPVPVEAEPVTREEFDALKAKYSAFVRTYDHRVDEFNRRSGIKF